MQRHNDLSCFIYAEAEIGLCKLKKLKNRFFTESGKLQIGDQIRSQQYNIRL